MSGGRRVLLGGVAGCAALGGLLALLAAAVREPPGRGRRPRSPPAVAPGEATGSARGTPSAPAVLYFFDRSCPDCRFVEEHLLERLVACRGLGRESVERLDVSRPAVLDRLLAIERAHGVDLPVLAPAVVVGDDVFCGLEAIRSAVERCSGAQMPEREGTMPCDARSRR